MEDISILSRLTQNRKRIVSQFKTDARERGLSRDQATQELAGRLKQWDEGEGFWTSLGRGLVSPFVETGRNIATAGVESARAPVLAALSKTDPERAAQLAQPLSSSKLAPIFKSEAQMEQIGEKPGRALYEQGVKPSAGVASYAIPFGKGASLLTKAAVPGAVSGGLQSLAQTPEEADLKETLTSVGLGSVVGAVTATASAKLSEYAKGKIAKMAQKRAALKQQQQTGSWKPSDFGKGDWTQENILKRTGTRLVAGQQDVPAGMGRATNQMETARKMADYGLANADNWPSAANTITGRDGLITKVTRRAVGKADDVVIDGWLDMSDDLLINSPEIGASKQKGVKAFFKNLLMKTTGGSKGSLNPKADPTDVFEAIQILEGKAASIKGGRPSWSLTTEDKAMMEVYHLMADELKDRLFIESGANNQIISSLSRADIAKLKSISPNLYDDVAAAKTVSQLRNVAKPFVDAHKLFKEGIATGSSPFYQLGGGKPKGLGKLAGGFARGLPFAESILESKPVTSGAGQALRNIGSSSFASVPGKISGAVTSGASKAAGALGRGTKGAAILPSLIMAAQQQLRKR